MPVEISLMTLLVVLLVVAFAGLVHGTIGIGFPLIATPLLSLVFDIRIAIMLTLFPTAAVNLASMMSGGRWRDTLATYWLLPVVALVGSYAGTQLIIHHDPAPYALLLSLLIAVYLGIDWYRQRGNRLSLSGPSEPMHTPTVSRTALVCYGLVAGFAAGTTNVMLPILIIFSLGLGLTRVTTIQVFNMTFLAGKLAQIGAFVLADKVSGTLLLINTPLVLVALLALYAGMQWQKRINDALFRKIIKALLALIAVGLVVQFFMQ